MPLSIRSVWVPSRNRVVHQLTAAQSTTAAMIAPTMGSGQLTPCPSTSWRPRGERQRHHDQPAAQQRGQRVHPLQPALVLVGRGLGRGTWRRIGHNPAAWASPRSVSRLRSRWATSGGSPGTCALLDGDAVCIRTTVRPAARSSGPAVTSTSCIRP